MKHKESYFHKRSIPEGEFGEISKVIEECYEAIDAKEQGQNLMFTIEVADIVGAIMGVCDKEGINLNDLIKFNKLRSRVYERERRGNSEND